MISFSNKKDNTLRGKRISDFYYFAMQMDDRRKVFFYIGTNQDMSVYGFYAELDSGETYFGAIECDDDATFFDIFGEDYKNIYILDKINVDIDCIINQDYE